MEKNLQSKTLKSKIDYSLILLIIYSLTAIIYVANAVYGQYFTKNPDTTQFGINLGLAILFLILGFTSFILFKNQKQNNK